MFTILYTYINEHNVGEIHTVLDSEAVVLKKKKVRGGLRFEGPDGGWAQFLLAPGEEEEDRRRREEGKKK